MNDMPDLNHVETFTPKLCANGCAVMTWDIEKQAWKCDHCGRLAGTQEEMRQAYLEYMELRIKRLERALLAIQVEPWRAKEIASQALTGL